MNDMASKFDKANITLLERLLSNIVCSVSYQAMNDMASKFDKANITLLGTATIQYSVFCVLSGDERYGE